MSDDPRRVELREKRVEQLRDCWSRLAVEYERARRWRDRGSAGAIATGLKIVDAFIRIEELTPLDGYEQEALATIRRVIRQSDIFENGRLEPFESDAEEGCRRPRPPRSRRFATSRSSRRSSTSFPMPRSSTCAAARRQRRRNERGRRAAPARRGPRRARGGDRERLVSRKCRAASAGFTRTRPRCSR
jgi:hypothetical protein